MLGAVARHLATCVQSGARSARYLDLQPLSSLGCRPLLSCRLRASTTPCARDGSHSGSTLQPETLGHRRDAYGGVVIDDSALPNSSSRFAPCLAASLTEWREEAVNGVWLKVPIHLAALVPIAVEQGFRFHHAEPDYVMLTHWLPDTASTLPINASHQVGVGACLLNGRGELLVVKERHGPAAKLDIWKVPTGLVAAGEDLTKAVVRELKEETGLDTEFESVLCLRQAHGLAFGKSEVYMLCSVVLQSSMLKSDSGQRPVITPDLVELKDARWMPVHEYHTYVQKAGPPALQAFADAMVQYAAGARLGLRREYLEHRRGVQLFLHP